MQENRTVMVRPTRRSGTNRALWGASFGVLCFSAMLASSTDAFAINTRLFDHLYGTTLTQGATAAPAPTPTSVPVSVVQPVPAPIVAAPEVLLEPSPMVTQQPAPTPELSEIYVPPTEVAPAPAEEITTTYYYEDPLADNTSGDFAAADKAPLTETFSAPTAKPLEADALANIIYLDQRLQTPAAIYAYQSAQKLLDNERLLDMIALDEPMVIRPAPTLFDVPMAPLPVAETVVIEEVSTPETTFVAPQPLPLEPTVSEPEPAEEVEAVPAPSSEPTAVNPFVIIDHTANRLAASEASNNTIGADQTVLKDALYAASSGVTTAVDVLNRSRVLNVAATPELISAQAVQDVTFRGYWNYDAFVAGSEIRIYKRGRFTDSLYTTLPVSAANLTTWKVDGQLLREAAGDDLYYTLRVYDEKGNFDETAPQDLRVSDLPLSEISAPDIQLNSLAGTNKLRKRHIPLNGGMLTVRGLDIPAKTVVLMNGTPLVQGGDGTSVGRVLLPNGDQQVELQFLDAETGRIKTVSRNVNVKRNDLFVIGLGDLTLADNNFSGPDYIKDAERGKFEDDGVFGRAAFFVKGKIGGAVEITARADTGEEELGDLIDNFTEKDTRSLLRRLDEDAYLATYGDDSTVTETAQSQGKLYLRAEKDKSHILWGNYQTNFNKSTLAHINRGLYGAQAHLETANTTNLHESRATAQAFFAEPGTRHVRDEFRGTGGSVYFLQFQDITIGSEKVRIEIRDSISGIVLENRTLQHGTDYSFDELQGRLVLHSPVNSTSDDAQLTQSGTNSGNPVFVVADYEVVTNRTDFDDNIAGAAADVWLNDYVNVGVVGNYERLKQSADEHLAGAHATLRLSPNSYLKVEHTQTTGANTTNAGSADGGFSFTNGTTVQADDAAGTHVELALSTADLMGCDPTTGAGGFGCTTPTQVLAYYKTRDAGFNAPSEETATDATAYGVRTYTQFNEDDSITLKADATENGTGTAATETTRVALDGRKSITKKWSVGLGAAYETDANDDTRTDVGWEVRYDSQEDWETYVFGQNNLQNDISSTAEDRYGIGTNVYVNEKVSVGGEVAVDTGDTVYGRLNATYTPEEDTHYYLAYDVFADGVLNAGAQPLNTQDGTGALTLGGRKKFNDAISIYAEEQTHFTGGGFEYDGNTHNVGLDVRLNDHWHGGLTAEAGKVAGLERYAGTAAVGRRGEVVNWTVAGEYRDETDNTGADRQTYVAKTNGSVKLNESFTALMKAEAAFSEGNLANVADGDFVETSLGVAYRPTDNDRLNALIRYQTYYDLATNAQQANSGASYEQKSQIASIDTTYDLVKWLSIGGKYGYKFGEIRTAPNQPWVQSDVHLGIVRADLHLVKKWDALAEYRMLWSDQTDSMEDGFLLAAYRHLGDYVKAGVGYNFARFDDDLTNVNFDNEGWFVNLVAKY